MPTASAPGKVILFGEHAVVYDKLGIACTFNRKCKVEVSFIDEEKIFIKSNDKNKSMDKKDLFCFFIKIKKLIENKKFDKLSKILEKEYLAPCFFVVGAIFDKYNFKGLEIKIISEIPKNLGSSSAVFSALALAVLNAIGQKNISKKEVSNFAYLGDVIAHGGTPSGIDNNIVTYGGYLQYQKSKGIKILDIDFQIPLLVIDSGEESKTGEMVSFIRRKKQKSSGTISSIFENLDNLSKKALNSLKDKKLNNLGELMNKYYQELKKTGISTEKLDQIVKIALKNKALGVKPTGGWGGGCCLVLAKDKKQLKEIKMVFQNKNFKCFISETGVEGVKII